MDLSNPENLKFLVGDWFNTRWTDTKIPYTREEIFEQFLANCKIVVDRSSDDQKDLNLMGYIGGEYSREGNHRGPKFSFDQLVGECINQIEWVRKTASPQQLVFPEDGYVSEATVRKLFHPGDKGQQAFEKAFRGCTMIVVKDEAFLPMSDLRDYLTYGRQTD